LPRSDLFPEWNIGKCTDLYLKCLMGTSKNCFDVIARSEATRHHDFDGIQRYRSSRVRESPVIHNKNARLLHFIRNDKTRF
jgi:hypothetical protein